MMQWRQNRVYNNCKTCDYRISDDINIKVTSLALSELILFIACDFLLYLSSKMHDCNKCGTKNTLWDTFKLPFKIIELWWVFLWYLFVSVPPRVPGSTESKLAWLPHTGHMYSAFSTAANTSVSASNFLEPLISLGTQNNLTPQVLSAVFFVVVKLVVALLAVVLLLVILETAVLWHLTFPRLLRSEFWISRLTPYRT